MASESYNRQRKWSDKFIPSIKGIVGPYLLQPSSAIIDMQQASDLVVMMAKDMMIAARIRKHGFFNEYPFDFTIRSKLDNGAKTELEKIISGWGDWMFYGHASADETQVEQWMLINLHSFRMHLIMNNAQDSKISFKKRSNGDGTHFIAYDIRSFLKNPSIIVSSSFPVPGINSESPAMRHCGFYEKKPEAATSGPLYWPTPSTESTQPPHATARAVRQ